jgi:hypothetical protein
VRPKAGKWSKFRGKKSQYANHSADWRNFQTEKPLIRSSLKNIPLLGDLFGNQNNAGTRKELLVLITPHVIRTQTQAADLTSDLQEALPNAAGVPALLGTVPPSTCDDPHEALRSQVPQ